MTDAPGPDGAPGPAGPLSGYRVLDLTSVVMGPVATQILGDLGADVITVESVRGDTNRFMGPGPHPELSGVSLNLLRNKRNVALDLKSPAGHEAVLSILASCDVLVTNLRPGALERLGLSYDDARVARPDVVYCQAQGYPTDSERADDPTYDDIVQAAAGVADATRLATGEPWLVPTIMADKLCGLTISYAVVAALLHRERTGEGQRIEVPMVDVTTAFMLVEHGAAAIPVPSLGPAGYRRILTPNRRPQKTKDGYVHILAYHGAHYDVLFRFGGREDLIGDPRYSTSQARIENADFLYGVVQEIAIRHTTAEWLEACRAASVPATPVVSLDELVEALPVAQHPVAGSYREVPPPVRFSKTPASVRRPAPLIGEHTREVLSEVGYSREDLDRLEAEGAIGRASLQEVAFGYERVDPG